MISWFIAHKDVIDVAGILGGLFFGGLGTFFAGFALRSDARVRRAETDIEVTKQHRDLWMYFDEHPELADLLDKDRDVRARPLAGEEIRFANFLFLHLRAAYRATQADIFVLPEKLGTDLQEILSYPALRTAWTALKSSHEDEFVAFVESNLKS